MDLGEALYRHITNGRSPHTEVATFGQALRYLVKSIGSVRAVAAELDVAASTLRGWLNGRTPRREVGWVTIHARQLQRRQRLSAGRERRLRSSGDGARIQGTYRYSDTKVMRGAENRDVPIGEYLDDGWQDDVLDAYLDGAELHELAEAFHGFINDGDFYADTFDPNNPQGGWDIDDITGWGS